MQYDERKSRSPNSIHFYLKKFNFDELLANKALSDYRQSMKGKLLSPSNKEYWIKKYNVSEEEAIKLVSESQTKKSKTKRKNKPYDTEIKNLADKLSCSIDNAKKIANNRRIKCSPRLKQYWINLGKTEEEAKECISEFQKLCSPRTIIYWIKNGYTYNEAIEKRANYQDNLSVEAISKKYSINIKEAYLIQQDFILNKSLQSEDEYYGLYSIYKSKVNKLTEITYNTYKNEIDNNNLRGYDYHLDHIVSIKDGFINEIPAEIIASKFNLKIVTAKQNLSKNSNSEKEIY
jgi:hypothetical protein